MLLLTYLLTQQISEAYSVWLQIKQNARTDACLISVDIKEKINWQNDF